MREVCYYYGAGPLTWSDLQSDFTHGCVDPLAEQLLRIGT